MLKFSDKHIIYVLLCLGSITISFNVAAIAAAIPTISLDLQQPALDVAKLIHYYMIPYGIGALIYAPLTRKFSYKLLLSIPLSLYSLFALYCYRAQSLQELLIGQTAMGISGACIIPLGIIVIGQLFEKQIRGRLVGGFFSCSFVASTLGIVLSGSANWRLLFLVPAIVGLFTALIMLLLKSREFDYIHGIHVDYIQSFKNSHIRQIFTFIFMISFLYHAVHKWFGVYLSEVYHLSQMVISFLFVLMSIGGAFGQMAGGFITDKKGRGTACLIGVIVLSFGTMLLLGTYPLYILGSVLTLIVVGWTIGHNGILTIMTDLPEDDRPATASLNSSVRYMSGGLGFFVSRFFVERSFSWTFFVTGIIMLLTSLYLRKIVKSVR